MPAFTLCAVVAYCLLAPVGFDHLLINQSGRPNETHPWFHIAEVVLRRAMVLGAIGVGLLRLALATTSRKLPWAGVGSSTIRFAFNDNPLEKR